jgi:hypothetical protein
MCPICLLPLVVTEAQGTIGAITAVAGIVMIASQPVPTLQPMIEICLGGTCTNSDGIFWQEQSNEELWSLSRTPIAGDPQGRVKQMIALPNLGDLPAL